MHTRAREVDVHHHGHHAAHNESSAAQPAMHILYTIVVLTGDAVQPLSFAEPKCSFFYKVAMLMARYIDMQ